MLEEGIVTDDTTIESDAWKNLLFMFDGRSILGYHTHPSEEMARNAAQESWKDLHARFVATNSDFSIIDRETNAHLFFFREYSHSIQIPWRKK
jgi:hypothetical protein